MPDGNAVDPRIEAAELYDRQMGDAANWTGRLAQMDAVDPLRAELSPREQRRRELWRWSKGTLVVWLKRHPAFVGSAEPLNRWNKTDLITSILDIEHPRSVVER